MGNKMKFRVSYLCECFNDLPLCANPKYDCISKIVRKFQKGDSKKRIAPMCFWLQTDTKVKR